MKARDHTVKMLRFTYSVWSDTQGIRRCQLVKIVQGYFGCSYSTANRVVKTQIRFYIAISQVSCFPRFQGFWRITHGHALQKIDPKGFICL